MATAIISPDEVAKFVPVVVEQSRAITIHDGEDYEMACTFLQMIAGRKKQVEETFDPIVSKAHAAHKEAVAQKKKFMDPLLQAESAVKIKVAGFIAEENRKRQEEEARLAAERKREQEEQAMREAAQLEAAGETELADIVIQNAVEEPAPVVVLESSVPKQEGISTRTDWDFVIDNEQLLPREFLMPNLVAIRAIVRSQKKMARIPGIRVFSKPSVSVRAR